MLRDVPGLTAARLVVANWNSICGTDEGIHAALYPATAQTLLLASEALEHHAEPDRPWLRSPTILALASTDIAIAYRSGTSMRSDRTWHSSRLMA